MILRLLVPALDRPGPATPFDWSLADRRGEVLREGTGMLADLPRADTVEAILPVSRVLSARLKLPRVNAATIRELLPFAVEDRLLADPAQIHAVPGATNAQGETLVAVVDREWLAGVLSLLSRAGLSPARVLCESALLPAKPGEWHAVLGAARKFLVEDDGHAVAFDPPAGAEPPLAVRIALDEAAGRRARPARLGVRVEPGVPAPDAALWQERAGATVSVEEAKGLLSRPAAANARSTCCTATSRAARRSAPSRSPRALAAALVLLQLAFTAADAWRLSRERQALEDEQVALFRAAFPEAATIVDPALQLRRNLADLQRSRGQASSSDFLALASAAGADAPLRGASSRTAASRSSGPGRRNEPREHLVRPLRRREAPAPRGRGDRDRPARDRLRLAAASSARTLFQHCFASCAPPSSRCARSRPRRSAFAPCPRAHPLPARSRPPSPSPAPSRRPCPARASPRSIPSA